MKLKRVHESRMPTRLMRVGYETYDLRNALRSKYDMRFIDKKLKNSLMELMNEK